MNTQPTVLAQLRHLYQNMLNGGVRDAESAKRIAEGLLGPAIEALERGTPATGGEPVGTVVHNTAADAQFAPRAVWPLNNFHDLPLGTKLYTSPQPVREPLSTVELMRTVMKADEESQDTRGTTNWAAHIGKAVQAAVLAGGAQPVREPAGWLYDWISDEGELVRDWFTTDYDEAHSEANQAHNIRALDYRGTSPQPAAHPATVAACIARLEQGGQSAAVSILRNHFYQKGNAT